MAYKEKINQLLAGVQELESLVGRLSAEENPGFQLLSEAGSRACSVVEGIKEIEDEQIRLLEARLAERQEERARLAGLLGPGRAEEEAVEKEAPQAGQGKGNVSLNDLLGKKNLSDFRKAFSLNDRFRFRRDLFRGDEGLMNRVIADLDRAGSLEEALRYIEENLQWDVNTDETAADFIRLLEKRYV